MISWYDCQKANESFSSYSSAVEQLFGRSAGILKFHVPVFWHDMTLCVLLQMRMAVNYQKCRKYNGLNTEQWITFPSVCFFLSSFFSLRLSLSSCKYILAPFLQNDIHTFWISLISFDLIITQNSLFFIHLYIKDTTHRSWREAVFSACVKIFNSVWDSFTSLLSEENVLLSSKSRSLMKSNLQP